MVQDAPPPPQHSPSQLERSLQALITRKQTAEKHIAALEAKLHDLETEYIRATNAAHGSLLKSLDGYHGLVKAAADTPSQQSGGTKGGPVGGHRHHGLKGGRRISDEERVFSRSSATWRQSVRWCRAAAGHTQDDDGGDLEAVLQGTGDPYDQDMGSDFCNDNASTVSSTTNNSPRKKKSAKRPNKKR